MRRLDTASPESMNNAIAHVKLGRTLLGEQKYGEAEKNTLAGYNYLVKQAAPTNNYLASARKDLAAIYDGLHRPQQAARFRAELGQAASTVASK